MFSWKHTAEIEWAPVEFTWTGHILTKQNICQSVTYQKNCLSTHVKSNRWFLALLLLLMLQPIVLDMITPTDCFSTLPLGLASFTTKFTQLVVFLRHIGAIRVSAQETLALSHSTTPSFIINLLSSSPCLHTVSLMISSSSHYMVASFIVSNLLPGALPLMNMLLHLI